MTISEISSKFDIPVSTLKDWRNPQNKKHKLFLFLQNCENPDTNAPHVRLLQILNRNINKSYKFSLSELKYCLKKRSYSRLTQREQIIISRLFKEGELSDAEELSSALDIPLNNIVNIYKSSPFFNQKGFEHWQNDFNLLLPSQNVTHTQPKLSNYLNDFFQNRGIHV